MRHIPPEDLSAYFDDELSPAAKTAVQAHLDECETCREALAEIAWTASFTRALPRRKVPAGVDFRVDTRRSTPASRSWPARPRASLAFATSAALVAAAFVLMVATSNGLPIPMTGGSAPSAENAMALSPQEEDMRAGALQSDAAPAPSQGVGQESASGAGIPGPDARNTQAADAVIATATALARPDRAGPGATMTAVAALMQPSPPPGAPNTGRAQPTATSAPTASRAVPPRAAVTATSAPESRSEPEASGVGWLGFAPWLLMAGALGFFVWGLVLRRG